MPLKAPNDSSRSRSSRPDLGQRSCRHPSLVANRFVNALPPARKETEPDIVLPFALLSVLKRHDATPLAALGVPLIFTPPIEAEHVMPLGRTADPPLVTRTDAATVDPALGLVGESLTPLAFVAAAPPPAGGWVGGIDSSTTMVIEDASLDGAVDIGDRPEASAERVRAVLGGDDVPEPSRTALSGDRLEITSLALPCSRRARALLSRIGAVRAPAQTGAELGAESPLGGDWRDQRDVDKDVEVAASHRDRAAFAANTGGPGLVTAAPMLTAKSTALGAAPAVLARHATVIHPPRAPRARKAPKARDRARRMALTSQFVSIASSSDASTTPSSSGTWSKACPGSSTSRRSP